MQNNTFPKTKKSSPILPKEKPPDLADQRQMNSQSRRKEMQLQIEENKSFNDSDQSEEECKDVVSPLVEANIACLGIYN